MSSRMNHGRVSMQKRVAQESYGDGPPCFVGKGFNVETRQPPWIRFMTGDHPGMSLPQILVMDPRWMVEHYQSGHSFKPLLSSGASDYQLKRAHQMEVLAQRAKTVLVTDAKRATHEFLVLVDRQGRLSNIVLGRRGEKLPEKRLKGRKVARRCAVLDLSIPLEYGDPLRGFKRLSRAIRRIFFDGEEYPSRRDIDAFFSEPRNFDLVSWKSHRSLISIPSDFKVLRRKYQSSLVGKSQ